MFDEQTQNPGAPKNLPTEPVDMFAGVEKDASAAPAIPDALSVGLLKKKDETIKTMPNLSANSASIGDVQNYKTSAPILGKIIVFILVAAVLGGVGYGAWWFFVGQKNNTVKQTTVPTDNSQTPVTPAANNTSNIPAQINNDQILFGQAVDSDKDGLDDVREKEIGTDPQKVDTDGDGLSDGDEVIIYKTIPLNADSDADGLSDGDEALIWRTNPLNQDTDGDSYLDGEEVRNGYSPVGPGKLFNSPTSTATPTNQ